MAEEKYITPQEAAEELRVTPQAVYKWIRTGRLRAERFGIARAIRIPVAEWRRFKDQAAGRELADDGHEIAPTLAAA